MERRACWAAVLLVAGSALAQQPRLVAGIPAADEMPRFTAGAREVRLVVTARDPSRGAVALTPGDVHVTDDGRPVGAFTSFYRAAGEPFSLALLLDRSFSTRRRFGYETDALVLALQAIMRPGDTAQLIGFAEHLELLQPATSDVSALRAQLAITKPGEGATRLFDGLRAAAERLASSGGRGGRAVIVISDGLDTASTADLVMALEEVQSAGALLYAIGTGQDERGERVLRQAAEAGGGRYLRAGSALELRAAFAAIDGEMRDHYVVTFRPSSPADGRFHPLGVSTSLPNVELRARTGYFAGLPTP